MTAIDSAILERYREAKATRHEKIDLSKLQVGARIKVIAKRGVPFFLEITSPSEGRAHLICDSGDIEVRKDIANADLGQRLIYCFSGGSIIPSRNSIEQDGHLWFDTFLSLYIKELFLLE